MSSIWNIEKEKDRREVGDKLAKLNEKKSNRELVRETKNKGDEFRWKNNTKILLSWWENGKCYRSARWKCVSAIKKEKEANRKTSIKIFCEHIRHFLHKTCNLLRKFHIATTTTARKCTKKCAARAKLFFCRIFRIQNIRRNILPKFIEICMETPCWCPPGWAPTWWTETNKNICYRVLVQKSEFISRGTHIHLRWLRIINEEGLLVIMWNCLIHIFNSSRCCLRLALNYYFFFSK